MFSKPIRAQDILLARKQHSNIGMSFFGLVPSSSTTTTDSSSSSSTKKPVAKRTITREAHTRNVQYLFEKVRQEAAQKELEKETKRMYSKKAGGKGKNDDGNSSSSEDDY